MAHIKANLGVQIGTIQAMQKMEMHVQAYLYMYMYMYMPGSKCLFREFHIM